MPDKGGNQTLIFHRVADVPLQPSADRECAALKRESKLNLSH